MLVSWITSSTDTLVIVLTVKSKRVELMTSLAKRKPIRLFSLTLWWTVPSLFSSYERQVYLLFSFLFFTAVVQKIWYTNCKVRLNAYISKSCSDVSNKEILINFYSVDDFSVVPLLCLCRAAISKNVQKTLVLPKT